MVKSIHGLMIACLIVYQTISMLTSNSRVFKELKLRGKTPGRVLVMSNGVKAASQTAWRCSMKKKSSQMSQVEKTHTGNSVGCLI